MLVRPRERGDGAEVDRLLAATADRIAAMDPRLRLPRALAEVPPPKGSEAALVAVDRSGRIRGHVAPAVQELAEYDEMRAWAADRSVTWTGFAADDPGAVSALAEVLRAPGTVGEQAEAVLWPSADRTAADRWAALGLEATTAYALRPPEPFGPGTAAATVRVARPEDEGVLVELHLEQVAFHTRWTPYARMAPGVGPAFRRRLAGCWAGADPEVGGSLVHVADRGGEVLGMAESMVRVVPDGGPPALLPPGRYVYLNSVGVREDARRGGLGRALAGVAVSAYGTVSGASLWYSLANPLSSRIWPRLGWTPLWTLWERRAGISLAGSG